MGDGGCERGIPIRFDTPPVSVTVPLCQNVQVRQNFLMQDWIRFGFTC